MNEELVKRYSELKEELIRASNFYYKKNISVMSDYEFDIKLKELEKMEEELGYSDEDSPTKNVGSDISTSDESNKHSRPMLSLENTYNEYEVYEFIKKVSEQSHDDLFFSIQPKYDGCSGCIRFKDGKVVKALTRGDGLVGEDITENIKLLDLNISEDFTGEVRGELILTKSGFAELNKTGKYQNARNLLAGSIKLLDHEEFKKRAPYIKFYAYFLEDSNNENYRDDIYDMQASGFDIGINETSHFNEIMNKVRYFEANKNNFDFEIDGVVIKVDSKSTWPILGSTSKFPRWGKAYKFHQEEVETEVLSIEYQVGRTGKVTPVANLREVFLEGSSISRATLNNIDFMKSLDIGVGDIVTIRKAAAIIPEITSVVRQSNNSREKFIKRCPCCGWDLIQPEGYVDYFCVNEKCKAKIIQTLSYFTHMMEIKGISEATLEKLYENFNCDSVVKLYYQLNDKEYLAKIANLPGFGDKTASNLCKAIQESKNQEYYKVLAALGIPGVGKQTAKLLVEKFNSYDDLKAASVDEIESIQGFGRVLATNIFNWVNDENNNATVICLNEVFGLQFESKKQQNNQNKIKVCITGSLSVPRKEFEEKYSDVAIFTSSVTSETSMLINNNKESPSSKNKKAKALNIPIVTEDEFLNIIKER